MSEFLCHYGIKGMKWGVRRYQNKDGSLTPLGKRRMHRYKFFKNTYESITSEKHPKSYYYKPDSKIYNSTNDDFTIAKGSKLGRVSFNKYKPDINSRVFLYTDVDRDFYLGFLAGMRHLKYNKIQKEVTFEANKDLKVAGNKTQRQVFEKFAKDYKSEIINELKPVIERYNERPINDDNLYEYYMRFGPYTEGNTFKKYTRAIKELGYTTLADLNDGYYEGMTVMPIISLDVIHDLKKVKVSTISDDDIVASMKRYLNK